MTTTRSVAVRPVTAADEDLLHALYRSRRQPELALLPWDEAAKDAFVRQQVAAQAQGHTRRGAHPDVVVVDGVAAGVLVLSRDAEAVHVVDVALLPAYRGQGVGEQLLADLQRRAAASGRAVTLHVERGSRARRLYERLGFAVTGQDDVHDRMEWRSGAAS